MAMKVIRETFGRMPDGREVLKFTFSNSHGLSAVATTYGATLISFKAPDRAGKVEEITLNYDTLDGVRTGEAYYGATCGRVANRIAGGKFTLEGTERTLAVNNGPNALHGGLVGFDKVLWNAEPIEKSDHVGVKFTYQSPDGDEGYPGNVLVSVQMLLSEQDNLEFVYSASTDQATPVNLTNHTYWNLSGNCKSPVTGHRLRLHCSTYTPVDDVQIPTGELATVVGTPFDFVTEAAGTVLGDRLPLIDGGGEPGLDHNFVVDRGTGGGADAEPLAADVLAVCAHVEDPSSGRAMTVATTEPGVQVYTGNFLAKDAAAHPHVQHNAMCLETQHFPNAINTPSFPPVVLKPGETYHHHTVHKFTVIEAEA